jgi:tetratricopeptide (TPR) repeat protein
MESSQDNNQLKQRIAAWLAVTKGEEISVGLTGEEATRRGRLLLESILDGTAAPESIVVDDYFKQVLSVIVALLRERDGQGEAKVRDANAVYQYIRRVSCLDDAFGETADLLVECAETGWAALGLLSREVSRRRETLLEYPNSSQYKLPAEACDAALRFFELGDRDPVANRDVILAICGLLRRNLNATPALVMDRGKHAFAFISSLESPLGILDERDYFLGRIAFEIGASFRLSGRANEGEPWLTISESLLKRTVGRELAAAQLGYSRLALALERGEYALVLEQSSVLATVFSRYSAHRWLAKCCLTRGLAFKMLGRLDEALTTFGNIRTSQDLTSEPDLLGHVLGAEGEVHMMSGDLAKAILFYERAMEVLSIVDEPLALGNVKMYIGEAYRQISEHVEALSHFQEGLAIYESRGMAAMSARARILIAETLLAAHRDREAEQFLLAALPSIEDQNMMPEAFAAVVLLKESIRQRKTDRDTLRELREHVDSSSKQR